MFPEISVALIKKLMDFAHQIKCVTRVKSRREKNGRRSREVRRPKVSLEEIPGRGEVALPGSILEAGGNRPIVSQVEIRTLYALRSLIMAERIGNIVYWFCCFVAAICFASGVSVWFLNFREGTEAYSLLAVSFMVAFLVWVIGRSLRYVFAGK
jgi:hypothetical protein